MKTSTRTLIIFILVALFSVDSSWSQNLDQTDKGGFYFYWGYNRSVYTKSDLRLVGDGYDFTMKEMTARDRPEKISLTYLDPTRITIPQFNIRMGYFFKDKWAATFGYDHLKYIMRNNQELILDGHIDPGVSTFWSGDYHNQKMISDEDYIHYENSDGNNYIRVGIARYFNLLSVGENNWFRVRGQLEASVGFLLPFNDLNFGGRYDYRTKSISGYGFSLHPGLRLEFFNHVFIQGHFSGGFLHHLKVRTRPRDKHSYGQQYFGYAEMNLVLGYTWRFHRADYDLRKQEEARKAASL